MTAAPTPPVRMAADEYLAWEKEQRDKHQLLGGEVFAMAGGSPRHNGLGANTLAALRAAGRGTDCRPLSSDQKVFVPATGNYVYPDATVVCATITIHARSTDVVENPRVVVEVLSKGTEQHERGDKWEDYRSIPSLTDYVLVSQRLARLEHFAREADGAWRYRVVEAGGSLTLTTGAVLAVDDISEGAFDLPGDA